MKVWAELYKEHNAIRSVSTDLASSLRQRLLALADRGLYIQPFDGRDEREPLLALPSLGAAHLTVLALVSRRAEHLHQFSATIEGTTTGGLGWAGAVHLEDDRDPVGQDRKGSGACGHAAFHCHIGPTLDDEPKVRVPLPAIGPADAFDWLLAIVVPGWEPARWADVVAARSTRADR